MKVYIIPSGWDRELVIKTAFRSGVDKICLISAYPKKNHAYSKSDKITDLVTKHLIKNLSKLTEVEVLKVNYADLKDIILQVNQYIKNNKDNELVINISTGSHILSAALFFVAQINNLRVECSFAKNHNPKIMKLIENGEDYHRGLSEIITLPSLPFLIKFNNKEMELLKKLKNSEEVSVSDFIKGSKGNNENRLRSEFNYLCKKLEKQGVIEIKNKGKKFVARLTDFGEIFIS